MLCRDDCGDFPILRHVIGQRSGLPELHRPPKLILDIGANVGYASILYANVWPKAKILAVEPEPGNLALLRENLTGYPQVTIVPGAVWPRSARLCIKNPGSPGYAFQVSPTDGGEIAGYTLSDLLEISGLKRIDLLKIDIEGGEKDLFEESAATWVNLCPCHGS